MAPLGPFNIAMDQVFLFLEDTCKAYPRIGKQFQPRKPVYRAPIVPRASAITFGHLEVQFRIAGATIPPPGAVVEILGFDWR